MGEEGKDINWEEREKEKRNGKEESVQELNQDTRGEKDKGGKDRNGGHARMKTYHVWLQISI